MKIMQNKYDRIYNRSYTINTIPSISMYSFNRTIRINHVKCPKCGTDMGYIGNQIDIGEGFPITDNNKYRYLGYSHVYRCPKCGKIKTV